MSETKTQVNLENAPVGSRWLMANGQCATKVEDKWYGQGPDRKLEGDRFDAPCFECPYAYHLDGTVGGTEDDAGYRIIGPWIGE